MRRNDGLPVMKDDPRFTRTLKQVADEWEKRTGQRITVQAVQQTCDRAMRKMRDAMSA